MAANTMRCMQRLAVVCALAIASVTLSGCGGSDKKREFHFVSQSFEDQSGVELLDGANDQDASLFRKPRYSLNLDMEESKVRIDMTITTEPDYDMIPILEAADLAWEIPASTQWGHSTSGILFDIPSKKIYVSSSQIKGEPPKERYRKECGFVPLTVEQADFKTCIAEKEKNLKVDYESEFPSRVVTVATRTTKLPNVEDSTKMDDYTDTIEWKVNDRNMVYKVDANTHRMSNAWEREKDTILNTKMWFVGKAGTPPAEVFTIPQEWGECDTEWKKDGKEWSIVEKAYSFVPTPIWTCMGMEVPSSDESDLEVVATNFMTKQSKDEGAATQVVV